MFACLFETNFPNIPFLKPKLFSFLAVCFFSSVAFVFVFMVSVFAWGGGFVFLFLVLLSIYEQKVVFPAILVFF